MKESKNLEQNLDKSNEKLHISDVSCSVCGVEIKHTRGHSFTWNGIYDIQRCECGTKVVKKNYN
jgi:hypothetical protein